MLFKVCAFLLNLVPAIALHSLQFLADALGLLADLAPDVVNRLDAPFEHEDAQYTWDGKQIL